MNNNKKKTNSQTVPAWVFVFETWSSCFLFSAFKQDFQRTEKYELLTYQFQPK